MKRWHWIVLGLLLAASLGIELTALSHHDKHWWNNIPGFYMIWGFVSCILIIYFSKWLGKYAIFREEDYYDQ